MSYLKERLRLRYDQTAKPKAYIKNASNTSVNG